MTPGTLCVPCVTLTARRQLGTKSVLPLQTEMAGGRSRTLPRPHSLGEATLQVRGPLAPAPRLGVPALVHSPLLWAQ